MQGYLCRRSACGDGEEADCSAFAPPQPPSSFDTLGRSGCNPPIGLLDSALSHMSSLNPNPDFILLGGDYASENLTQAEFGNVLHEVLVRVRKAFPSTAILPIVGDDEFHSNLTLAELFDVMSIAGHPDPDSRNNFVSGGYYEWQNALGKLRVVMLNTALMTGEHSMQVLAEVQWAWLEEELRLAEKAHAKVVLCGHSPPGLQGGEAAWDSAVGEKYQHLVQQYSQVVMLQLFGHHSLDLLRASGPQFALLGSAGLSPVGSAVPSFMSFTHNFTLALEALTLFCDLDAAAASGHCQWSPLSPLTLDFHVSDVSAASLFAAVSAIKKTPALGGRYLDRQLLPPQSQLTRTPEMDKADICETGALDAATRSTCLGAGSVDEEAGPSRAGFIVFFALGSVAVVGLLVWMVILERRRRFAKHHSIVEESSAKRYAQLGLGWQ